MMLFLYKKNTQSIFLTVDDSTQETSVEYLLINAKKEETF